MKKLILIAVLLLLPGMSLAANDICVHLNGGDDVAYIGEYNTMEIWIANDVELRAIQFPLKICWPSDSILWSWDMTYGYSPPFDKHGDAINDLMLFSHLGDFDGSPCDTFVVGAAGLMPPMDNLPPGPSRLLYSLRFGILSMSGETDHIVVEPFKWFASNNWMFQTDVMGQFPPDFCGEPVPSMDDPSAPPVSFPIVHRSAMPCGDVDCNLLVNISDAVYLISYIFGGGPVPCASCP